MEINKLNLPDKQPLKTGDDDKLALANLEFDGLNAKLKPLMNHNALMVQDHAQAELASRVINDDIPKIKKLIWEWWGEDRRRAYDLYRSLQAKENTWLNPLNQKEAILKGLVASWQLREKQKREQEAAKQQAIVDKKMPGMGVVVQAEKPHVEGASLVIRKKARLVEDKKLKLLKLIVEGKAHILDLVSIDEAGLNRLARDRWDVAETVVTKSKKKGEPDQVKRYLFDRTVELYEDAGTSRR